MDNHHTLCTYTAMSLGFWNSGFPGTQTLPKHLVLLLEIRKFNVFKYKICVFYEYKKNILFLAKTKLCILKDPSRFLFLFIFNEFLF